MMMDWSVFLFQCNYGEFGKVSLPKVGFPRNLDFSTLFGFSGQLLIFPDDTQKDSGS